eukprot:2998803-Pyramimonas_sp.AAC.1
MRGMNINVQSFARSTLDPPPRRAVRARDDGSRPREALEDEKDQRKPKIQQRYCNEPSIEVPCSISTT